MWKVFDSQDGSSSVLSDRYGVSYHSKYGALQESRHVFIEAGLYYKAIVKKELNVLEVGFGTGLNALLTCLEAEKHQLRIDYTAIELFPLPMQIISQLNFTEALQLHENDTCFEKIHTVPWEQRHEITSLFSLEKIEVSIESAGMDGGMYDLIYYDAFAPNVQPELWEEPIVKKMFDVLVPGGIFVTYCAKGDFKRALKSVGFKVETLKGPPGKREMTRAIKEQ